MYDSYILYIKVSCPFCIKAIDRLEKEQEPYKTIIIDDCSDGFISQLKEAYGHKSFPMVLGYDAACQSYNWIGGCDSLMDHLNHSENC